MHQYSARKIKAMYYMIVLVWLIFFFTTGNAHCDTFSSVQYPGACDQPHDNEHNSSIKYIGLQDGSSLCIHKREVQYSNYFKAPLVFNESIAFGQSSYDTPRADLMTVFKLALEEFDFLSGMRIYWEYTARNFEELAIRLRLKGEASVSGPYRYSGEQPLKHQSTSHRHYSYMRRNYTGVLSLFKPQRIRWNLGVDPDDLSLFGDLHLNSHCRFSFEFGEEEKIGLHFQLEF